MNCLVTGASRGIGLAVAQDLASRGFGITLCARNADLLVESRDALPVVTDHQVHDIWVLDMANPEALGDLKPPRALHTFQHYINCAGIAGTSLAIAQTHASMEQVLQINLLAPIMLAKQVARAMIRHTIKPPPGDRPNSGDNVGRLNARRHIVFLSSILAQRGAAGSALYSASKAGLEGFTRSFAREVGRKNIAVNCIAPGLVDTDMGVKADPALMANNVFPGLVSPKSVAETVSFLLQAQNITGQSIVVDNGCSI